jgi:hypothetical protein
MRTIKVDRTRQPDEMAAQIVDRLELTAAVDSACGVS